MSDYTPTTQQVEDGFAHEPEYEYRNPIGYGAHVQSNRRAFRRWLAEVEWAAAEKAWDEGHAAGEQNAGDGFAALLTGVDGFEPRVNPYRREETE